MILSFQHGLGDNIQFRIVLDHLRASGQQVFVKTHPEYQCLFPACYHPPDAFQKWKSIKFFPRSWTPGWGPLPITKTTYSLRSEFGIEPDISLFRYSVDHLALGERKIQEKYALVHTEGVTCPRQKNLNNQEVLAIKDKISEMGLVPIMASADTILELVALIQHAEFVVGIDSGVEHLSLALGKKTHVIFKEHHPFNFFEPHPQLVSWISPLSNIFVHHGKPVLDWHYANYTIYDWKEIGDIDYGAERY